jgi:hypothetical protein
MQVALSSMYPFFPVDPSYFCPTCGLSLELWYLGVIDSSIPCARFTAATLGYSEGFAGSAPYLGFGPVVFGHFRCPEGYVPCMRFGLVPLGRSGG